eukprot:5322773-Lingulodinium_polyedra.AAC.1
MPCSPRATISAPPGGWRMSCFSSEGAGYLPVLSPSGFNAMCAAWPSGRSSRCRRSRPAGQRPPVPPASG